MKRTETYPYLGQARQSSPRAAASKIASVRPTKLQETCGRLAELAQELGPEAKLPTVLQLRDRLGVSVATLNAALSELEAQRLIRRKHGVGIYVSPRIRQRSVALVCDPSFFRAPGASPFWNLLVDQARRRAAEGGEVISLHFAVDSLEVPNGTPGSELLNDGLADEIGSGRVDGVLGVGLPQAVADWMERQGATLVAFAGPGRCTVGIRGEEYARLGVPALVRKSARRIAFLSPVSPYRRLGDRVREHKAADLLSFEAALKAYGLPFDPALVRDNRDLEVANGYHTLSHQEQGFRAAQALFGAGTDPASWPDGIVSTDDMLTSGLLTGLGKLGVVVGRDVQIASHANAGSPALLGWEEELTLMEVDPAEIVSLMFSLLETCMDGEEPENPHPAVLPRPRDQ